MYLYYQRKYFNKNTNLNMIIMMQCKLKWLICTNRITTRLRSLPVWELKMITQLYLLNIDWISDSNILIGCLNLVANFCIYRGYNDSEQIREYKSYSSTNVKWKPCQILRKIMFFDKLFQIVFLDAFCSSELNCFLLKIFIIFIFLHSSDEFQRLKCVYS